MRLKQTIREQFRRGNANRQEHSDVRQYAGQVGCRSSTVLLQRARERRHMSTDPVRQVCGEAGAAPGIEALDRVEDQELRIRSPPPIMAG